MDVQLIYISEPTAQFEIATSEFVPTAIERNKEHNITGMLIANENFYLQILEGEKEAVNQLYKNILGDHRHKKCLLLRYSDISSRQFSSWSMITLAEKEIEDLAKACGYPCKNGLLRNISGLAALCILRRISLLANCAI